MAKVRAVRSQAAENPEITAEELVSRIYDEILQEGCAVFIGSFY
jgi:hypothetical protein